MSEQTGKRNIERLDTVDSTNTVLKTRIAQGLTDPSLVYAVTANEQTSGRGRRGRIWLNTEGALMMSIAVHIDDPALAPLASVVSALAAYSTIRPYCPNARIKWPNDVVAVHDGELRKLCGILSELVVSPNGDWFTVLGTGINANCAAIPGGLLQPASSIYLETGRMTDLTALSYSLYDNTVNYMDLLRNDSAELLKLYSQNCVTIGSEVKVIGSDGVSYFGKAESIDEFGRLNVVSCGEIRTVSAADVSVRSA